MALPAIWTPNDNPRVLDARCARCRVRLGYAGPEERAVGAVRMHAGFEFDADAEMWRLSQSTRAQWAKQVGHVVWTMFVPTGAKPMPAQLPATVRCLCRKVNEITTAQDTGWAL